MSGRIRLADMTGVGIFELALHSDPEEHLVPKTPSILIAVVQALQERIAKSNPLESGYVAYLVRKLAVMERVLVTDGETLSRTERNALDGMIKNLLRDLTSPGLSKDEHHWGTVKTQRHWLAHYLDAREQESAYPTRTRNQAHWKLWVKEHVPNMLDLVNRFPCYCRYPSSEKLAERIIKRAPTVVAPGKLIALTLASLHRSTPSTITSSL